MKITTKHIITSSMIAMAITWLLTRPKKAIAEPNVEVKPISTISLIGDSQTMRHFGEAYKKTFPEADVRFIGREGYTHSKYLQDKNALDEIKDSVLCAELIVIQLGDNGVSNSISDIENFIKFLKRACPNAEIIWAGPMKAVKPSVKSSYVNVDDPSSPRFITTYNNMRKVWDTRLANTLSQLGIKYISNFDIQDTQPLESKFSDSRKGDGVHLTEDSALELATIHKNIIMENLNVK